MQISKFKTTNLLTTFHLLPVFVDDLTGSVSLSNVLPSDVFDVDLAGPPPE